MFRYFRVCIFLLIITCCKPGLLLANYTFNDPLDTNLSSSWITIAGHISPDLISNFDRTYARFHQGGMNSYAYLANKSIDNNVVAVKFDFYYPNSITSQGAGFMLTNKVPIVSQNPPNDNGDYSVGIWPISGNFYLLSPLCDNTNLCNLPIYNRAIFKINVATWNTISINYLIDRVRVKLNEAVLELPYGSYPLPNGFFLGNPVLATNSQSWMDFYIDNFSIEYGDPTIVIPTFPYLSQKDPMWGSKEYDSASIWAGIEKSGIDRWGCALTSVAMILQKNGVKTIDDNTDVNPDNLNTWLRSQPDGYIGPGLLNWLAITRYANESYAAGHAATKLEYERSHLPTTPVLPAIIGTPGHFIVAYDEDVANWTINDPTNSAKATLAKTSTVNSINRFVPSLTNLSYMMFTTSSSVSSTLKNERGDIVPVTWTEEYLTDDVDGTDGSKIRVGMIAKPETGKYLLETNQDPNTSVDLHIYLYDNIAQVVSQSFTLVGARNVFEINYSQVPEANKSVTEIDVTPPHTPTLLSPADFAYVNTNGLVLDWSDVTDPSVPVTYNYKSSWPGGNYGPVTTGTSSYIAASGTPDQTYLWQVQACDNVGNCSEWGTRTLTVDSASPSADLVFPAPGPSSNYFEAVFSERVDPVEATSAANYFLSNWPGAGGSGDLVGDVNITYNPEDKTARIIFTNPGWYISPEQLWGVQNIHDLSGNILSINPYTEYTTEMIAPVLTSTPVTTPNPTNQIDQTWSWLTATDVGSGVKGYSARTYDVIAEQYLNDWLWLGQVLGTTTNLSEGNWQLTLRATDNAGNNSEVINSNSLLVDTTAPSTPTNLHFDNPSLSCGGFTKDKYITIDWDDSTDNTKIAGYEYNIDYPLGFKRGSWTTFFATSSYRGSLNEGIHYIKLRAKDTAGNYSAWSNSCAITYDFTAPTLKERTTFVGWYREPQTSYFDFADTNLEDSYLAPSCELASEGIAQTCKVQPNICDKAKNCYTLPVTSNSVNIDLTKPSVTLDIWGRKLQGTSTDRLSLIERTQIKLTKPDGSIETVTPTGNETWEYTVADAQTGDYKAVIVAYDYAGNVSDEVIKEYNIGTPSSESTTNAQSEILGTSDGPLPTEEVSKPRSSYQATTSVNSDTQTDESQPNSNENRGEVLGESTNPEKFKTKYLWLTVPVLLTLIFVVSRILKSRARRG